MSDKSGDEVFLSEVLLGGAVPWPKPRRGKVRKKDMTKIVYEDDLVIAWVEPDDEAEPTHPGELHVTVAPKEFVPSLLDLSVSSADLNAALLNGIQKTAFALGLHKTGFEIRANVLPPYQHAPGLRFKIRSGKPKKSKSELAAEAARTTANGAPSAETHAPEASAQGGEPQPG